MFQIWQPRYFLNQFIFANRGKNLVHYTDHKHESGLQGCAILFEKCACVILKASMMISHFTWMQSPYLAICSVPLPFFSSAAGNTGKTGPADRPTDRKRLLLLL